VGPTSGKQPIEGKHTGLEDEGSRMPSFGQQGGNRTRQILEGGSKGLNPIEPTNRLISSPAQHQPMDKFFLENLV
jgi:hypothetical protein